MSDILRSIKIGGAVALIVCAGVAFATSSEKEDVEEARKLRQQLWDNRVRRLKRWAVIAGVTAVVGAIATYKTANWLESKNKEEPIPAEMVSDI